jgi:hypothetical protein
MRDHGETVTASPKCVPSVHITIIPDFITSIHKLNSLMTYILISSLAYIHFMSTIFHKKERFLVPP